MASSAASARASRDAGAPFERIVCGIDGSRSSPLAAEQAIALAGPSTALVLVCVRDRHGSGATRQETISLERADHALREAVSAARAAGIDAVGEILPGRDPTRVLLDEASRADLLVVASHGGSRAGGIAFGSTASAAVHRAQVPVLVARRPPEGETFPRRILVATDGSAGAERAIELTARVGRRHGSAVHLLSVEPEAHGDPKRIAVHAVTLTARLEREPTVVRCTGAASEQILALAADQAASLVVTGSRGLGGLKALGSVSERVAHRAGCSVLVARPA